MINKEIWPQIEAIYKLSEEHHNLSYELKEIAGNLELSYSAFYEDQYNHYCELIEPHLGNGSGAIGPDQLTNSVTDTLNYLIQFWLEHREIANAKS